MMDFIKSPNYNERPAGTRIWAVVLHASVNSSLEGLISWFQNPESQVSSHYCIGKDGTTVQMVKDEHRAWHAGVSEWAGVPNVNDFSIGIELVNLNDGQDPYPVTQVEALLSLLRALCSKYDVSPANVVRHADVSDGKTDPRGLDMDKIRTALAEVPTTPYIHGLHAGGAADGWGSTGADLMLQVPGTILFTEIVYTQGRDYRPWASLGFRPIARLNHSYGSGTIPVQADYQSFANECARFVSESHGCHFWQIGNETNLLAERPPGEEITPSMIADCFTRCEKAIHALPGHEGDLVVPAPVGPWNAETGYPGNEAGDWVTYFQDMLTEIINRGGIVGAIVLHAYTHGPDKALITDEGKMGAPFGHRFYNFQCYREFMAAIPQELRYLPVVIGEANQDGPWVATGWIDEAYAEIDRWNHEPGNQQIRAMCLFRYPPFDKYYMEGKTDVLSEFRRVVSTGYKWTGGEQVPEEWQVVHKDALEGDFYDQDGIGELTIPTGHRVGWDTSRPRPEMDAKRAPQEEVYEGNQSAVGFLPYATFRWWTYTDPILVTPNKRTRASAAVMIVAHGIEGDPSRPGNCAMRVGIGGPNEDHADSANIVWSDWFTVRGNLDNERKWVTLRTPETIPTTDRVKIFIQCNADVAADISAGHWDLEVLEQYLGSSPKPPPGDGTTHTVRTYLDDQLVAEGQFTAQVSQITFSPAQPVGLLGTLKAFFKR